MQNFVGREGELATLRTMLESGVPGLAVIYGRRRIGKSCLIRRALEGRSALFFEGLEGQSKKNQINNFLTQLKYQVSHDIERVSTWREAFMELLPALKKEPACIVLDEFQWLANYRSDIVADLKMVWDQYFCHIPGVSMILCGSIASYMTTKVIRSKALYGRTDRVIHLREFQLHETKQMLPDYGWTELIEAQEVFGGVPKYLELAKAYPSLYLAVEELAFRKNSYFTDEFDRIFVSHFGKNDDHRRIIESLADHPYGLFRKELAEQASVELGGTLFNHLRDLESAGFISSVHPIDKESNSRLIKYYLSDAYLRFFFAFIKPNLGKIRRGQPVRFSTIVESGNFLNWKGRAFEQVCTQHAVRLAEVLGFSGIDYSYGPFFRARNRDLNGIQIDLLFDRADNVLSMCEMKSSRSPIGKTVESEIERKLNWLRTQFPKKTVQGVLIYDGELTEGLANSPYVHTKVPSVSLIE